jgi:hypothetical protein
MGSLLRLLLIEDFEDDALMVLRELKRSGYDVVHTRVETAEALTRAPVSVNVVVAYGALLKDDRASTVVGQRPCRSCASCPTNHSWRGELAQSTRWKRRSRMRTPGMA